MRALLPLLLLPALLGAEDPGARVAELVKRMESSGPEGVWTEAPALEALGRDAVPALKTALAGPHEGVRLAAARALLSLGEGKAAVEALAQDARKGSPEARSVALHLLGSSGGRDAIQPLLALLDDESLPLRQRVSAASALWACSKNMRAPQLCRRALEDADGPVRNAAALALGGMGQMSDARTALEDLALSPTDDGERARELLLRDRMAEILAVKQEGGLKAGDRLLAEIVSLVQRCYVDEEKTALDDLVDAAAKGIASSLDPHTAFLNKKEVDAMHERMEGQYAGVGAVVSRENGAITIVSTFFKGPAWKAGIRSGDVITKIEGQGVVDLSLDEAVRKLKGTPGTEVSLELVRRGVSKPIPFTLVRAVISVESVFSVMLPGKVGYLRLTQFGEKAGAEVRAALEDLRKQGMRGLVFDLRDNGGGLLNAAVEVADMFLKPGKLIVYSEGRNPEVAPREDYYSGGRFDARGSWVNPPPGAARNDPKPDFPMATLIDRGSASASEILGGALRDHGRSVLVGDRSFGKGSVQQLLHLKSEQGTMLKLTIAKYYLPSGRCIHGVGVEPDIHAEPAEVAGWKFEEYRRLVGLEVFTKWLDAHPVKGDAALAALAEDDGGDPERYPGFAAFYEGLKTSLSKDDIRLFLRRLLRERVAEDRGVEFKADLEDDLPLQRAALEVVRRMGVDPATLAPYSSFAGKFKEEKPAK